MSNSSSLLSCFLCTLKPETPTFTRMSSNANDWKIDFLLRWRGMIRLSVCVKVRVPGGVFERIGPVLTFAVENPRRVGFYMTSWLHRKRSQDRVLESGDHRQRNWANGNRRLIEIIIIPAAVATSQQTVLRTFCLQSTSHNITKEVFFCKTELIERMSEVIKILPRDHYYSP